MKNAVGKVVREQQEIEKDFTGTVSQIQWWLGFELCNPTVVGSNPGHCPCCWSKLALSA